MLEKIKEITAESLGADAGTITEETSFKEDLGADSLDLFEMVMAFEEAFEVEIPSEDLEQIQTVGDVVKCLVALFLRKRRWHEDKDYHTFGD